jgi:hypothetical protein
MLREEELAFIKAISNLQLSPALLREIRMALSRRKKKPVVLAGSRSTASGGRGGRSRPTNIQSARGQAQSQQAWNFGLIVWACQQAPSTWRGARNLYSQGRIRCCRQPATRAPRVKGNVRGYFGRACHPVSAKWVAQAHSHGFRPVWTRCLIRDSQ